MIWLPASVTDCFGPVGLSLALRLVPCPWFVKTYLCLPNESRGWPLASTQTTTLACLSA